ncbi:hypothetical protein VZT92_007087 [Zoarces viviparus]|uniref:AGC-kinase C-terminal domain-containing protein n=1 Tax=Zoarces viviparus TaxID=48416 RepID=A0AAW1FJP5_ZOAVI
MLFLPLLSNPSHFSSSSILPGIIPFSPSRSHKLHLQKNRRDTCNFDKEFTKMPVDLTPTDKLVIMNLDQDDFLGFSFTNAEYVAPGN